MGWLADTFSGAVDRLDANWDLVTDFASDAGDAIYQATIKPITDTSIADFEAGLEILKEDRPILAVLADAVTTPLQIAKRVTGDEGRIEPESWSQAILDAAPTVAKPVAGFFGLNTLTTEEQEEADARRAEEIDTTRKLTEAIEEYNEHPFEEDDGSSGSGWVPEVSLTEGQKASLQIAGIGLAAVSVLIAGVAVIRRGTPGGPNVG